jgi:cytochrome o ubiquinol oxidase subunit 2
MRFAVHGLSEADFAQWVQRVKAGGGSLQRQDYLNLEKPSEREPIHHYGSVDPGLFGAAVNMCVDPSKMCRSDMMHAGAQGGFGLARGHGAAPLDASLNSEGDHGRGEPRLPGLYAGAICTASDTSGIGAAGRHAQLAD